MQIQRSLILVVLTLSIVSCQSIDAPAMEPLGLEYLATADQVGPVAYRDPLGAVSPDGHWLAYSERERVNIIPVEGGAVTVLGPGSATIRFLTWLPDSRHIAVRERLYDQSRHEWYVYDRIDGSREPLWPSRDSQPDILALDMLTWSADGYGVAGVARHDGLSTVWVFDEEGGSARSVATASRLSFPAWARDGQLACLAYEDGSQYLRFPCDAENPLFTDQEVYGQIAFARGSDDVYYGAPGAGGFLDLWTRPTSGGRQRLLSGFARDAYAPSVDVQGSVVYKSQDYRVFLATAPAKGGDTTPLTTFQSETPSWNWDGTQIGFTFGAWRHVTDDIHYPDIAQNIGVVGTDAIAPKSAPDQVLRQSYTEDQAMNWSPNGRWVVFHTHEGSDDIWLMRADGSGEPRMISVDGHETGWARWSPDGRWIAYSSYRRNAMGARRGHLYLIGVDQETGAVTHPQTQLELSDFDHHVVQGEWGDNGETLILEVAEAIGKKSLWSVPRTGGRPTLFHEYTSEQNHSGISVSPDGYWTAYVERANNGYQQVFRLPVGGGQVEQLTFDPSHKTQPTYSPAGDRIAFTVFSYLVHFWQVEP